MTTDFNGAAWSASELLTEVYRACRMSDTGTVDYTPSVVLRMASDAIWNWAGHQLSTAREGRMLATFERSRDYTVSEDGGLFELPPMAIADAIDSVQWVETSGDVRRLTIVPDNMLPLFTQPSDSGEPTGYALQAGTIRVFPPPESGTLRVNYQRRHGELVVGSDTSAIVSAGAIDATLLLIQPSVVASAWVTGAWVDIIGSTYPYRTEVHGGRIVTTGVGTITVECASADAIAQAITGSTVATYGKTPYVSLPLEMRTSLTQHVAGNILAELGDASMAQLYEGRAESGAARTRDMLNPRTKADNPKLYNPNSLARGARGRRRLRTDSF